MSFSMKYILVPLLIFWGLGSQAQVKRILPKSFKKLELGMSMERFAEVRKEVETDKLSRDKFRYRWEEKVKKRGAISSVVYYFGDGEGKPLYELILYYRDLRARDQWLEKNYGVPNYKNNTEWRFATDLGFEVRAWRYEDRLIIAAMMPGTEWEGE